MSGLFDASLPQSLYGTLPNVFVMTLRNKSAQGGNAESGATADTYGTAQTVRVRRRPANDEERARNNFTANDRVVTFSVLDDGTGALTDPPRPDGRITDEGGTNWTVKEVTAKVLETLFSCVCVPEGW